MACIGEIIDLRHAQVSINVNEDDLGDYATEDETLRDGTSDRPGSNYGNLVTRWRHLYSRRQVGELLCVILVLLDSWLAALIENVERAKQVYQDEGCD